ncbi:hypothetical protein H0H92_001512 [Tricholoma furcatifolium]|nr:hypothetical protein H0H92_001512 [Tricholoma furcatifolium]
MLTDDSSTESDSASLTPDNEDHDGETLLDKYLDLQRECGVRDEDISARTLQALEQIKSLDVIAVQRSLCEKKTAFMLPLSYQKDGNLSLK